MAALRPDKQMSEIKLPLAELANVIRSKNAGPLCVTLDLFFPNFECFQRAAQSDALQVSSIASLYGLLSPQVKRFDLPEIFAGHPGDGDLYGAQQHAPLLSLRV